MVEPAPTNAYPSSIHNIVVYADVGGLRLVKIVCTLATEPDYTLSEVGLCDQPWGPIGTPKREGQHLP